MFSQFTNRRLDNCAYGDRISQSVKPSLYKLNPVQVAHCDKCDGRNVRSSDMSDRIHIDSLLRGVGMPLSDDRCTPYADFKNVQFAPGIDCKPDLQQNQGRLVMPAQDLRGTVSSRWDHPLFAPQAPLDLRPLDTRRIAKDNHCAYWDEPLQQITGFKSTKPGIKSCDWKPICE